MEKKARLNENSIVGDAATMLPQLGLSLVAASAALLTISTVVRSECIPRKSDMYK